MLFTHSFQKIKAHCISLLRNDVQVFPSPPAPPRARTSIPLSLCPPAGKVAAPCARQCDTRELEVVAAEEGKGAGVVSSFLWGQGACSHVSKTH